MAISAIKTSLELTVYRNSRSKSAYFESKFSVLFDVFYDSKIMTDCFEWKFSIFSYVFLDRIFQSFFWVFSSRNFHFCWAVFELLFSLDYFESKFLIFNFESKFPNFQFGFLLVLWKNVSFYGFLFIKKDIQYSMENLQNVLINILND